MRFNSIPSRDNNQPLLFSKNLALVDRALPFCTDALRTSLLLDHNQALQCQEPGNRLQHHSVEICTTGRGDLLAHHDLELLGAQLPVLVAEGAILLDINMVRARLRLGPGRYIVCCLHCLLSVETTSLSVTFQQFRES